MLEQLQFRLLYLNFSERIQLLLRKLENEAFDGQVDGAEAGLFRLLVIFSGTFLFLRFKQNNFQIAGSRLRVELSYETRRWSEAEYNPANRLRDPEPTKRTLAGSFGPPRERQPKGKFREWIQAFHHVTP